MKGKKNDQEIPKLLLRFFRWFCRPEMVEDIEGDLVEKFHVNMERKGIQKASESFAWQVFLLFRPGIIRPITSYSLENTSDMFRP